MRHTAKAVAKDSVEYVPALQFTQLPWVPCIDDQVPGEQPYGMCSILDGKNRERNVTGNKGNKSSNHDTMTVITFK